MRYLIVDDDFVSRNLLLEIVKSLGRCDIAVNGSEAITAVRKSIAAKDKYDAVFLDIILEEIDGQEVLKKIREEEASAGISGLDGAKIIMTTVLNDFENIKKAFSGQCEGYIIKPVTREKIEKQLRDIRLIR